MYNNQLDLLQNQLNLLKQQQMTQYSVNNVPNSASIESMVQKAIQEEFAKLLPQPQITPQVQQQTTPVPMQTSTIEQEINKLAAEIVSPDQLQWLSKPEIFNGIPLFLKTKKGKEAVNMLIEEYKTHLS